MPLDVTIAGHAPVTLALFSDVNAGGGIPMGDVAALHLAIANLGTAVDAQFAALNAGVDARFTAVDAQFAVLNAAVNVQGGQLAVLNATVNAQGLALARAFNSSALVGTQALQPVPNNAGLYPPWFPLTRNALLQGGAGNMTAQRANALLAFYNLNLNNATLEEIQRHLAEYFGVRI